MSGKVYKSVTVISNVFESTPLQAIISAVPARIQITLLLTILQTLSSDEERLIES